MYVNCQGALAIEIWPGIFILKNLKVHQNQKNGAKQPNGYILSAYEQCNNTDINNTDYSDTDPFLSDKTGKDGIRLLP